MSARGGGVLGEPRRGAGMLVEPPLEGGGSCARARARLPHQPGLLLASPSVRSSRGRWEADVNPDCPWAIRRVGAADLFAFAGEG
jgi:hypothetical protein